MNKCINHELFKFIELSLSIDNCTETMELLILETDFDKLCMRQVNLNSFYKEIQYNLHHGFNNPLNLALGLLMQLNLRLYSQLHLHLSILYCLLHVQC